MTAGGDELAACTRGSPRATTSSMPRRPVLLARAPGRLDVMGGIADYSGSLVLELPLAVATWVAVQAQRRAELVIDSSGDARSAGRRTRRVDRSPLAEHRPRRAAAVRRGARPPVRAIPRRAWAAYVAGALVVLHATSAIGCGTALGVLVRSGRADRQRRQLVGRARGGGVRGAGGARRAATSTTASSRSLAPEGREPRRRRALRRDGSDDGGVRPARPPARAALPARRGRRPRRAPACTGGLRHRLGHPPRGLAAPTTATCAPPRSWATASSPTPPACGARRRARRAWPSTIRGSAATSPTSRRPNGARAIATPSRKR